MKHILEAISGVHGWLNLTKIQVDDALAMGSIYLCDYCTDDIVETADGGEDITIYHTVHEADEENWDKFVAHFVNPSAQAFMDELISDGDPLDSSPERE